MENVSYNLTWNINYESEILKMKFYRYKETVLLYCTDGKILELFFTHDSEPKFREIINDFQKFDLISLLNPSQTLCILARQSSNTLTILNVFDGTLVSHYTFNEDKNLGKEIPNVKINNIVQKIVGQHVNLRLCF